LYIFETCCLDSSSFFSLCCSIDTANASGAGIVDKLLSRPNTKIILVDEIEKMNKRDQNILLNLLEIGILRSTKVERPVVIHS
jgi:Cdc6-like AAA superfamily ATPase